MNGSRKVVPVLRCLLHGHGRSKAHSFTHSPSQGGVAGMMKYEHPPCKLHARMFSFQSNTKTAIPETRFPSSFAGFMALAAAGFLIPLTSNLPSDPIHCDSLHDPSIPTSQPNASISPHSTRDSDTPEVNPKPSKKKLVILGSGWGAISVLKGLNTDLYDVSLVSPRNYFLFTPLLPEVSSGSIESRSISEPIRKIIRAKNKDADFYEAECTQIDPITKVVKCKHSSQYFAKEEIELKYDYLVIAVGAENNTFNTPGVKEYCHFLKEVEDAEKILRLIVDRFETASLPSMSEEEIRKTLHFVVVGGGPTGVEFAAELHDLIHEDFIKLYPNVVNFAKITLVQSGDHILNMFDKRISDFAEKKFQRDKIDVHTNCRVLEVKQNELVFFDKNLKSNATFDYGLIVWSTGIGPRPLIVDLMQQIGQNNRRALCTDEWLRVKNVDNVWAIGDCSTIEQRKMMDDLSLIFEMADSDNDGFLSVNDVRSIMQKLKERYPQVSLYLRTKTIRELLGDEANYDVETEGEDGDTTSNHLINIAEFKTAVEKVDKKMKNLPATAQVAAQQGEYLSKCLNHLNDDSFPPEGPPHVHQPGRHKFHPFKYVHLGQFAPLGGGKTGAELPGDWVNTGRSSQWLWYSVYFSKQVSWRTKSSLLFDWIRRAFFGRDSSRI